MPTVNLAYAEAYSIKEELGGGFRGVAKNRLTNEVLKGERRDTLLDARNDAVRFVFQFAGDRNMTTGTYKSPKGLWRCNYFIRADEA